jgi:mannan endo-1,4-beta-mannosidase
MHNLLIIAVLVLIIAFTAGCAVVDEEQTRERANLLPVPAEPEPLESNDHQTLFFPISRRVFSAKLQIEEIMADEREIFSDHPDFEGKGAIRLREKQSVELEINVPTTQHYTIGLRASGNSIIALSAENERQGAFYFGDTDNLTEEVLHGIFLASGINTLTLTSFQGTVFLDFITVNNYEPHNSRFDVSRLPANQNASVGVRLMMDYFAENYGKRILLAQHVTPGTNSEIGAIFEVTGRFPAIRVSDLMRSSRSFSGDLPVNDDIELAIEWAKAGGIVSYGWTWHSPSVGGGRSHYYAGASDFYLDEARTVINIASFDLRRIEEMYESGTIPQKTYELVRELDHIAEELKRLREENIPVLWRPMHQAGTEWFWWSNCHPESYIWLWRLMFERFSNYHGLDNLIWVWAGQSERFYPGDGFVDIIGEDIYNMDNVSNMPTFIRSGGYPGRAKLTAMTECGLLPAPDLLARDGAFWLWTALYRGDFLTDHRGRHNSLYNTRERLERTYNHELTITLDKLPERF